MMKTNNLKTKGKEARIAAVSAERKAVMEENRFMSRFVTTGQSVTMAEAEMKSLICPAGSEFFMPSSADLEAINDQLGVKLVDSEDGILYESGNDNLIIIGWEPNKDTTKEFLEADLFSGNLADLDVAPYLDTARAALNSMPAPKKTISQMPSAFYPVKPGDTLMADEADKKNVMMFVYDSDRLKKLMKSHMESLKMFEDPHFAKRPLDKRKGDLFRDRVERELRRNNEFASSRVSGGDPA